ncbi:hypothetical protein KO505_14360 [Psychrosphaera sp. F3M07]|uniref:hypothetical protein n=1 Tax=Psychrosphaera sp. F3M07 TaxID=2841560 RepID=UPI001C086FC0|nr:hypothetical protein [Psychrosphaera sp. F3M07]MBU2919126.1 hypothetical protein [Psychrosphaera sp. F3M07]
MKLDPLVIQIIVATNFDNFTTSDVRASYMTLKNDPLLDPVDVRRKLYGELLKLVKKGWLNKKSSNGKGFTRFSKTKLFDTRALNEFSSEKTTIKSVIQDIQQTLIDKLKYYKTELLLNIGETDAYKELYTELPELVDEIQPQYNIARDNNTKILGKIRAIESLMKQDGS